jgi:glycerol-3-phosphate dehydrogenase (NAD(P)+)
MSEATIAVIGAGAWGTALAILQARAGRPVTLWARQPRVADEMTATRSTPRLPGIELPPTITIVSNALPDADIRIIAVPMQHIAALPLSGGGPLVLCCKGVETGTLRLAPEIFPAAAILTGPNFADEIAAGLPAAAVLATPDSALRTQLMQALRTDTLRLYGSPDSVGAALGGAAKNVIAIAAGMVIGAGLGENARAALITRGIVEIGRLAAALGGRAETISGLSGLGDLLLTCTGTRSRNFSLGLALGRGEMLGNILAARTNVTEGVATAPALLARGEAAGVDMPVTAAVTQLLAGRTSIAQAMSALMGRAQKEE